MKIAIRYFTRTGNTKKLADAIGKVAGVTAETTEAPLEENIDILFLGSSVYAAGVDDKVRQFIRSLDPACVKKVVSFSTAALLPSTYDQIVRLLSERGIAVDKREYHCRGRLMLLHRDRPNGEDIAEVQRFARQIMDQPAPLTTDK